MNSIGEENFSDSAFDNDEVEVKGPCPKIKLDENGNSVEDFGGWIVSEIRRGVTLPDAFPFHERWNVHINANRVENLFQNFKVEFGLPDSCYKWFNNRANTRWRAYKNGVLKPYYAQHPTLNAAKRHVPDELIGKKGWHRKVDNVVQSNCKMTKKV